MSREIQDNAAIAFSRGFYRALGYECSMEQAFEFGRNAIQLEISGSSRMRSVATDELRKAEVVDAIEQIEIPEHLKPVLKTKPTLSPGARANITAPEQPLSQETRVAIQLDIDRSLEADAKVKPYRDRVREFLNDRKLSPLEIIRLERLRKDLGLSESEAGRILAEEQEPIRQAQDEYEAALIGLIEAGHYPFDAAIQAELQALQQELGLSNEEVAAIVTPIVTAAEEDYRAKLVLDQQQEYERRLQHYEQKFREASEAQYPIESSVHEQLRKLQQSLKLSDEDVARAEKPIVAPKEVVYQQRLAEEERQRKAEEEHQEKLKQQEQLRQQDYQVKLQRYEQEFRRKIESEYPIKFSVRDQLRNLRRSLELSMEDVDQIEKPIIASKEAEYQQQLAEQQHEREKKEQHQKLKLLEQQRQKEYQAKLQRYEQEFKTAIQAQYPTDPFARDGLKNFQQSLGLSDEDVTQLEQVVIAKNLECQQGLGQQERPAKLQRYEQEMMRVIETRYPISYVARSQLSNLQWSLGLSTEDIEQIEKPIIAGKEKEYQRQLAEQRKREEEERQRQRDDMDDVIDADFSETS
jgi:hypothetical protein